VGAGDSGYRWALRTDSAGNIVYSPGSVGALEAQPSGPTVSPEDASEVSGGGSAHEGDSTKIQEKAEKENGAAGRRD